MCTAVIVASDRSKSGKPMLMKHRDISYNSLRHKENGLVYCCSKRYGDRGILAVVDKGQQDRGVLCGMNVDGFSIINTATYNLGLRNYSTQYVPSKLMYDALSSCSDKRDFERLLESYCRRLMPANYGIIDRQGNASYYEVSERNWQCLDVAKEQSGCLTFTNYSRSGDSGNKPGLERQMVADRILNSDVDRKISVSMLLNEISRSFRNDLLGLDMLKTGNPFGEYFFDGLFIPLRSTTFSAVFEGNVIWVSLGYPPISISVPVIIGCDLPDIPVHMFSNAKKKVFDLNVGEGNRYFNFSLMYDRCGNGFTQRIMNLEEDMARDFRDTFKKSELADFYEIYLNKIMLLYTEFLQKERETDRYSMFRICDYGEKKDEVVAEKSSYGLNKILKVVRRNKNYVHRAKSNDGE